VSISRDEWLKALVEIGETVEDDQQAVTVAEFAEMFTMSRCTASRRLELLVTEGKATRTRKRLRVASNNRLMSLIAFRLAP
jgi:DeoR/GlpR family transcriptional regulator of sugar metabolism